MASRILVTGGTGHLGRALVPRLGATSGSVIRVMSHRPRPSSWEPGLEWAQADLETGEGLADAIAGVQTIVHAASSPARHSRQVDVDGTRRLLEQAQAAGVSHLVYISIVGVDRISYSYYRNKLAAERLVENGAVPWSMLRATQFHELLDLALSAVSRLPVFFWPTDLPCQPVAAEDVAGALCQSVVSGAAGRLPDLGGPEVLQGPDIVYPWLVARRLDPRLVHLRLPGRTVDGFRRGYHLAPENRQGRLSWREWITRKYK